MTPQELQSLSHQLAATLAAEEEKKQKQETMKALMREGLKGSEKFDADKWTQKLPFYPSDIPEGGFMEQKLPFYPSEVQGDPEDWSQPMSVHSNFDEGGQYTGNFQAGQVDPYKSDPRQDRPDDVGVGTGYLSSITQGLVDGARDLYENPPSPETVGRTSVEVGKHFLPGAGIIDAQESWAAGSRGLDSAEGTRNFVVFDENLISIVKKYGIAGAIGLGLITQEQGEAFAAQYGEP